MDRILDHSRLDEGIVISDMGLCQPAEALADKREKHHWHLIPYEAEQMTGTVIGACSLADAPDVTLPLGVSGWHAVYVGIWNPHYAYDKDFRVKLKLTDDPSFRPIADPEPPLEWPGKVEFKEVFFKYADLTGRDLVIGQHTKGTPHHAYVGYVKLVPLSPAEVQAIQEDRARTDRRMMLAFNDGNGLFYNGPTTREDLLEEVEQYRYSDVKGVLFAASSGDVVNYPSQFGIPWLAGAGDAVASAGHRILRDSLETLLAKDVIPMRVLSDHMHEMGLEFHVMFRMGIIGEISPSDLWNAEGGLVQRRPDLRMVDMDGTPIEKASYAFPEVREFMLSMIREVIEGYDVDGVNLGFIRGPHFAGYEDIVIEDFKKQYGQDPRELDENDICAQRHRASYVTELVRQARQLVDEVAKKKAKKISLTALAYSGKVEMNLFFGLDLMAWIKQGLTHAIFMSEPLDPELMEALSASDCQLMAYVGLGGEPDTAHLTLIRGALKGIELGATAFGYWDMNGAQTQPENWEVIRQIGDKEQLKALAEAPPKLKTTPLKTVEGFDVCHTTNRGANERGYWPPEMLHLYAGG